MWTFDELSKQCRLWKCREYILKKTWHILAIFLNLKGFENQSVHIKTSILNDCNLLTIRVKFVANRSGKGKNIWKTFTLDLNAKRLKFTFYYWSIYKLVSLFTIDFRFSMIDWYHFNHLSGFLISVLWDHNRFDKNVLIVK